MTQLLLNVGEIWLIEEKSWTFHKRIPMMLNCFGIDKLHGFMMHSVMLAIGHISCENYYSFQFSNVGSYAKCQSANSVFGPMVLSCYTVKIR